MKAHNTGKIGRTSPEQNDQEAGGAPVLAGTCRLPFHGPTSRFPSDAESSALPPGPMEGGSVAGPNRGRSGHFLMGPVCLLMAVALLPACLSAPPQSPPSRDAACLKAHEYSIQRHADISNEYQRTNLILGATGSVLWFAFPEALAIPLLGWPVSYYQHESLAERSLESLERSCGRTP